jgi:hypothetical protein
VDTVWSGLTGSAGVVQVGSMRCHFRLLNPLLRKIHSSPWESLVFLYSSRDSLAANIRAHANSGDLVGKTPIWGNFHCFLRVILRDPNRKQFSEHDTCIQKDTLGYSSEPPPTNTLSVSKSGNVCFRALTTVTRKSVFGTTFGISAPSPP